MKKDFLCSTYVVCCGIFEYMVHGMCVLACLIHPCIFPYSTACTPSFGQQAEAMPKLFAFYCNTVPKSTALTRWLPSSPLSEDAADCAEKWFSISYVNTVSPVLYNTGQKIPFPQDFSMIVTMIQWASVCTLKKEPSHSWQFYSTFDSDLLTIMESCYNDSIICIK